MERNFSIAASSLVGSMVGSVGDFPFPDVLAVRVERSMLSGRISLQSVRVFWFKPNRLIFWCAAAYSWALYRREYISKCSTAKIARESTPVVLVPDETAEVLLGRGIVREVQIAVQLERSGGGGPALRLGICKSIRIK